MVKRYRLVSAEALPAGEAGRRGSLRRHGAHLLLDLTFPVLLPFSGLLLACEPCLFMSTEGSREKGEDERRNGVVGWYRNMGVRDEGARVLGKGANMDLLTSAVPLQPAFHS